MENAKCYAPQILVGTEGLPREQWLEYRRKGIGGSDAAAVLGISPFRTGRDLYYDKLNIVTADDAENWVQLEVGTLLEPLVAKIFAHKTGYKIYRRPFMFWHPQYPWMLADLDYMVELSDGTSAILEIKTTNYNAKDTMPVSRRLNRWVSYHPPKIKKDAQTFYKSVRPSQYAAMRQRFFFVRVR